MSEAKEMALRELTGAQELLVMAASLPVDTEDDLGFAAEVLADVKGRAKRLDETRKRATGPMREAIKEVDGWFAPVKKALAVVEAEVKARVSLGRQRLDEERARTAAAAAQVAREAGTVEEAVAALAVAVEEGAPVRVAGVSFREAWELEVYDEAALPREYLVPDWQRLRALARERKGDLDVPGCRAVRRDVVASRST